MPPTGSAAPDLSRGGPSGPRSLREPGAELDVPQAAERSNPRPAFPAHPSEAETKRTCRASRGAAPRWTVASGFCARCTQTHLQPKRRARIPSQTETRIGNLLPFASNSAFVRLFLKRKPTQMRKADFAQTEVREEDECFCAQGCTAPTAGQRSRRICLVPAGPSS